MQTKDPYAALLQTVDLAARLARQVNYGDDEGSSGGSQQDQRESTNYDGFIDYDEEFIGDGLSLRRYSNGTVRMENIHSGVMQEERPDGSLLVSLPHGKVISQQFKGEPLLVWDTNTNAPPRLAKVSAVHLPDADAPALMYHFDDNQGTHLVDLESLRYFYVNRSAYAAAA